MDLSRLFSWPIYPYTTLMYFIHCPKCSLSCLTGVMEFTHLSVWHKFGELFSCQLTSWNFPDTCANSVWVKAQRTWCRHWPSSLRPSSSQALTSTIPYADGHKRLQPSSPPAEGSPPPRKDNSMESTRCLSPFSRGLQSCTTCVCLLPPLSWSAPAFLSSYS